MMDYHPPDGSPLRSSLGIVSALVLAVATCVAVFALSAHTARTPAVADEAVVLAGPVCFFQSGQPTCVERTGPDVSSAPEAVTPDALLTALLSGPTSDERVHGIESALPSGTRLVSVSVDGPSITVHLAFPAGYLVTDSTAHTVEDAQYGTRGPAYAINPLAVEAIEDQIFRTLLPLGYRNFHVEAQDPSVLEIFRPLSAYLPPLTVPRKGGAAKAPTPDTSDSPLATRSAGQPPVEALGRPQGALSGKTVYVSAGHGWQWNGIKWRTQRPPYPDALTGYYGPIIEDHNNAEVVNQYLLRYLWNAGADVWTVRERDLNPFEQIVDDNASGFIAAGGWGTVNADGYSNRYLAATTTDVAATAIVTWTTGSVSADGVYALYVWYASGSGRTSDARYTVYHAGGTTDLSVDQRHHGYTWRYVGRFPLRAGERLAVSLSNLSSMPGQVVVADAIRLGGGWFDDADLATHGGPVETEAPYAPDKPWWEIAAYYSAQRLGIDLDDYQYFGDVIARPLWARWEHAGTGDDAVYISWHTNGYNGHNTKYWGTISYIHDFQPVAGSAALRHAIHGELINDIRAGWDANWRDLGKASRNLGELRELWDEDADNAIPGVLLEIAYHDNVDDTDALKDPRFALLSARAVYHGIAKYFGDGLPLLPEPPTHLVVRNHGPGQIKVNWRPSPTDTVGLVGDAAESYRVYTSRDGLGWDGGQVVAGTETTLTGLEANELIFVRVTAVNAGGESFPTPVLAARSGPNGVAQVLLVDGYDRINRSGLVLETDPTEGFNARLFPAQINSFDYAIEHGEAITLPFDSALNEVIADGDLNLSLYNIVDWILGEESTTDRTFDAAEQAAVAAYLDSEGALFVSGAEIGWDLVTVGNGPDFYHTYLGADLADDDGGTYMVEPTAEGIFAGLGAIAFRDNYDVDYPDELTPLAGSVAALNYLGGTGGTAAIQYAAEGCRRVVYLGFPFETIAAAKRSAVMARVLNYLSMGGCLSTLPQTAITTPVSGEAFNIVPDFGGTATGVNPIQRVEVQIKDPDERYWDGQAWITASSWLTAVGTAAWSYPMPMHGASQISALQQGEYHLWASAWDTDNQSDTRPALSSFVFDTISPTTPTLIAPASGMTLGVGPAVFRWSSPLSDAGSTLGYSLQIDDHYFTSAITSYTPLRLFATGVHTWRVQAFDAAGNRSPRSRSGTFYADNVEVYLPALIKGYPAGTAPACVDVIVNGGFESQDGWIINDTPMPASYTSDRSHSGARSMRLGIVPPLTGTGSVSYSSVDQTIPIPDGIGATLTLWLYSLNEGDDDDLQYIGLIDEEGAWTFLWSDHLDTQSWSMRQVDLTHYAGQTVALRFSVKNDGDDATTALYVDDVSLEVCGQ